VEGIATKPVAVTGKKKRDEEWAQKRVYDHPDAADFSSGEKSGGKKKDANASSHGLSNHERVSLQ